MNRLAEIVRRHAAAGAIVLPLTILVHALGTGAVNRELPLRPGDVAAGPYPLLPLFAWFDAGLPVVGGLGVGSLALMLAAAVGFLLAAWRITRNRVVAAAATFLFAAHPAAVAATHDAAGLRDVVLFLLVAWGLALGARPRVRSARYPNRPPHPAPAPLAVLMVIAALSTPFGWTVAPVLILLDLAHGAREGRSRRDVWLRGYLVHAAVVVGGVALALLLVPAPAVSERITAATDVGAAGARVAMVFSVRHADDMAALLRLLAWALALGGGAVGVLDVLVGIGRRRTLVPHAAFCGGALLVVAIAAVVSPESSLVPAGALVAAGAAILLAALFWRLAVVLVPDVSAPEPSGPTWADVMAHLALEPLPPLAEIPSIAAQEASAQQSETPAARVEKILERLESRRAPHFEFQQAAFDALARPVITGRSHAVVAAPFGSPWPSASIACVERMTVVSPPCPDTTRVDEFTGVPGVRREELAAMPWSLADGEVDALVAIGVFESVAAVDTAAVLRELRRVSAAHARGVFVFPRDGEVTPELAADLLRGAGFAVEAVDENRLAGRVAFTVGRGES